MTPTPDPRLDVAAYLERIGYQGLAEVSLDALRAMHRAHFYSVPFENLDIHTGVRIAVDGPVNFAKIVTHRRGGFCLELSGLFARVLRQIGFRVDVLGARVMTEGRMSVPLSHMTLLVHLEEPWLVDVGFGGRVAGPLRLLDREPQLIEGRKHVLDHDGNQWILSHWDLDGTLSNYVFTLQPRAFREFDTVCHWLQTSPDSRFTQARMVSLARPAGRTTFAAGTLIETLGTEREEHPLATSADEEDALRQSFGIILGRTD
ncbi:MAG: arylamine N-acetyltransferase [Tepidiformaceae bacterium]